MESNEEKRCGMLEAKIEIIFDLLKIHTSDEAFCIIENVQARLESFYVGQAEIAEGAEQALDA